MTQVVSKAYVNGNTTPSDQQTLTYYSFGRTYEEFADVIGLKGKMNPCSHHERRSETDPVYVRFRYVYPGSNPPTFMDAHLYISPTETLMGQIAHATTPTGLDTLAAARIPATTREDLSGLINLAEMRSMTDSIASGILGASARLALAVYSKQPTKRARKAFKKAITGETTYAGFCQRLIGSELEWKFGWKPFLKDLSAATNVMKRAAAIRKRLQRGYRVFGLANATVSSSGNRNVNSYGPLYSEVDSYVKETRFRATASIMRRIKQGYLGPEWQLMLPIYTELLGLKPSLSKGWELVPLSFVVDWLIPIGSMIESFEGMTTPQSNWIESYDGLYSLSRFTTVTGTREATLLKGPIGRVERGHGTVTQKSYDRVAGLPSGSSPVYIPPLNWPIISPGKWFTGMELLLQRMLR